MIDAVASAQILYSHTLKLLITMRHVLHTPSLEEQLTLQNRRAEGTRSSGYGSQTMFPVATLNTLFRKNVADKATFGVRSAGAPEGSRVKRAPKH